MQLRLCERMCFNTCPIKMIGGKQYGLWSRASVTLERSWAKKSTPDDEGLDEA